MRFLEKPKGIWRHLSLGDRVAVGMRRVEIALAE